MEQSWPDIPRANTLKGMQAKLCPRAKQSPEPCSHEAVRRSLHHQQQRMLEVAPAAVACLDYALYLVHCLAINL